MSNAAEVAAATIEAAHAMPDYCQEVAAATIEAARATPDYCQEVCVRGRAVDWDTDDDCGKERCPLYPQRPGAQRDES